MKKYNDIIEEIKAIPRPEDVFERENRHKAEYAEANHDWEKMKEIAEKHDKEYKAEALRAARKKILDHNARIALLLEYFPIIIEVLNKYAGKRIGEKTKDKIREEINERTGVSVWIEDNYSRGKITIYHRNNFLVNNEIILYAKKIDNENNFYHVYNEEGKLNTLSADMFDYDRTDKYIEDIDGYINRKMQELSEVNAAIKALTEKIRAYDSDLPAGFKRIDYAISDNNRLF